jgi:hypothetical protein
MRLEWDKRWISIFSYTRLVSSREEIFRRAYLVQSSVKSSGVSGVRRYREYMRAAGRRATRALFLSVLPYPCLNDRQASAAACHRPVPHPSSPACSLACLDPCLVREPFQDRLAQSYWVLDAAASADDEQTDESIRPGLDDFTLSTLSTLRHRNLQHELRHF